MRLSQELDSPLSVRGSSVKRLVLARRSSLTPCNLIIRAALSEGVNGPIRKVNVDLEHIISQIFMLSSSQRTHLAVVSTLVVARLGGSAAVDGLSRQNGCGNGISQLNGVARHKSGALRIRQCIAQRRAVISLECDKVFVKCNANCYAESVGESIGECFADGFRS